MKKLVICFVLLFLSVSVSAAAREKMTWLVVHWPPFQILEGPDKGKGRFDALLELYKKNLPQYEHQTVVMNWARFWAEIQQGTNVCSTFAIKTPERSQYAVFSKPLSIALPQRIIMRGRA